MSNFVFCDNLFVLAEYFFGPWLIMLERFCSVRSVGGRRARRCEENRRGGFCRRRSGAVTAPAREPLSLREKIGQTSQKY